MRSNAAKTRDDIINSEPQAVKRKHPWLSFKTVRNMSDAELQQAGFILPPFHFHCRTTTAAVDVKPADGGNALHDSGNNDGLTLRAMSAKVGDTDGYSKIESIKDIPFDDVTARTAEIERFCKEFADAKEEHALVFTKEGKAYQIVGTVGTVNPAIIGEELLKDSIGIHNHPIKDDDQGDSFSCQDLTFSVKYGTDTEYLISGTRRNAFRFTRYYSEDEIYNAWKKAKDTMLMRSIAGTIKIDWEQEIIMQILAEQNEGIEFYEYF